MPDPYNLSEQMHARMELSRRIGFAKGQIREAMGYIDGRLPDPSGNSHLYWAYKALGCALDELDRPIEPLKTPYQEFRARHGVEHAHCPNQCEHPQPQRHDDGTLVCCFCHTPVVPCVPETCELEAQS